MFGFIYMCVPRVRSTCGAWRKWVRIMVQVHVFPVIYFRSGWSRLSGDGRKGQQLRPLREGGRDLCLST